MALTWSASERPVWLVKVPQFVHSQWQSLAFLQEREAARARFEPALVAALAPLLRGLLESAAGPGEVQRKWGDAAGLAAFGQLLMCARGALLVPRPPLTTRAQRNGVERRDGGGHAGSRAGGCAVRATRTRSLPLPFDA